MTALPTIEAVEGDAPRPFWSVMIPTYEPDPTFLERALAAVLAQDPGPAAMEIALVDDGSDRIDPRRGLDAVGTRVAWFRQERHVGMAGNWNTCLRRARGQWIHLLHQDDLVRPGFYDRLREGIESAPAVGAAFCRDVVIDGQDRRTLGQIRLRHTPGIVDDWIEHIFVALHLRASALVVRRSVYEALGGFRPDLPYALDWDMWKRIAARYPLWYEPQELACYRRHRGCASVGFARSGTNIAHIRRSIDLSASLLPAAITADVTRRALRGYTRYAVTNGWRALRDRDFPAGLAQIREARRLTSALAVIVLLFRIAIGAERIAR